MILYYAMGGGLGHLTRARAVAHTLGIRDRMAILTASPSARDRRVRGDAEIVEVPPDLSTDPPAYRAWLRGVFDRLSPGEIYLDSFPAGILGELENFMLPGGVPVHHVARLLRWPEYRKRLGDQPLTLARSYVVEPLAPEHEAFLHAHSREIVPLALEDPPAVPGDESLGRLQHLVRDGRPLWLVVHAGPPDEIRELVTYAEELRRAEGAPARIVLASPRRPDGFASGLTHLDLYPASLAFALADCIVTACGFNAMRQTESYRERHRFLPFPRRLDDQFARAARRRRGVTAVPAFGVGGVFRGAGTAIRA